MVHSDQLSRSYLEEAAGRYSVIAITGFILNESGTMTAPVGPVYATMLELSRTHRCSIYPHISFRSSRSGAGLLSSERARIQAARSIASLARRNGFRGIHLDLEYLPPEYASRLGILLDLVRKEYHGMITMAVFPPVGFPERWSGFHDLRIIAPRVDQIVLMCYDLHGSHTGPGPVTDIEWAEKNIQYAGTFIDTKKIWLGMPAYGYRWCGNRAVAVSAKRGKPLAGSHDARRDPSGTLSYRSGNSCITYLSDRRTRSLLIDSARRHGCAGTALWRIGFED